MNIFLEYITNINNNLYIYFTSQTSKELKRFLIHYGDVMIIKIMNSLHFNYRFSYSLRNRIKRF